MTAFKCKMHNTLITFVVCISVSIGQIIKSATFYAAETQDCRILPPGIFPSKLESTTTGLLENLYLKIIWFSPHWSPDRPKWQKCGKYWFAVLLVQHGFSLRCPWTRFRHSQGYQRAGQKSCSTAFEYDISNLAKFYFCQLSVGVCRIISRRGLTGISCSVQFNVFWWILVNSPLKSCMMPCKIILSPFYGPSLMVMVSYLCMQYSMTFMSSDISFFSEGQPGILRKHCFRDSPLTNWQVWNGNCGLKGDSAIRMIVVHWQNTSENKTFCRESED